MSSVPKIGQTCLTAEETYDLLAPGPRAKTAPRPLTLRSNFSWTFAGNVVYAGCQWGMLMVLAKLGSPEWVGQFALGLALTAPVIMLTNLQLRAIQATDARREYRFGHYLALRLVTTTLSLLVIAGLACGYRLETAMVILAVGLAKAFESFSDVVYGLLQAHERMDRIALSMMIKGPFSLAALGATVYFTVSIAWGALALAGVWGLLLIAYDIPNGIRSLDQGDSLRLCLDLPALVRLAWLALPLGIVMMLISLNTNIPRYFIEHYRGNRELGMFAALAYLMVAGHTVMGALGQSASSRLARYYAEGNAWAFRRLLYRLEKIGLLLGAVGVLLALLAGRQILSFLYSPEYAVHTGAFVVLMASSALWYTVSMLGCAATASRRIRFQSLALMPVVAVSVVSCWILVPPLGILGAAYSSLLASATCSATYLVLLVSPEDRS